MTTTEHPLPPARLILLMTVWLATMASPSAIWSQGAYPDGPEFQLNTRERLPQDDVALATLADGSSVVIWRAYDIFGQRYDALGAPMGDSFRVNSYTTNFQSSPSIAPLPDGGFAVVWYSWTLSHIGIRGQRFDADSMPVGGEWVVNSYTGDDQYDPKISALADGGFIVVWDSRRSEGSDPSWSLQGRRFNSGGSALGEQFQINTFTTDFQIDPAVAGLTDGGFVVVWEGAGAHDPNGIHGRLYDRDGSPGDELQINTHTTHWQREASVEALPDGKFVVVWQNTVGPDDDIHARLFAADGSGLGNDWVVNSFTTGSQRYPSVAALDNGSFVVTWTGRGPAGQDSSNLGIRGQRFATDGSAIGSGFTVDDELTSFALWRSAVAPRNDAGFMVAWERDEVRVPPSRPKEIQGRRYAAPRFALVGLDGKCLDVEGADPVDGTPVNLYRCNAGDHQRWRMDLTPVPQKIIGLDGKCLVPGPIHDSGHPRAVIGTCGPWDATFDRWQLAGGGPSSPAALVHVETGLCLDVEAADADDGAPVQLFPCHGRINQAWRPAPEVCTRGSDGLCLNQERFRVDVEWTDFDGNTGSGQLVRVGSDDSGLLWFFERSNWEMLVKVLDGCAINDRFWVFAAATTTVEYTLTVTDTALGTVREYFNPLGNAAAAITDTDAFATCSADTQRSPASPAAAPRPLQPLRTGNDLEAKSSCLETPTTLCLTDDRFSAEVEWRDPAGNVGVARRVETEPSDSGMFWFFSENNWEMLIKVLDGCEATGRFWMLAAATTDIEYTLRVTETETGAFREYFNPQGNAASALVDTFETCP